MNTDKTKMVEAAYAAAGVTMQHHPELDEAYEMGARLRDSVYDVPPQITEQNLAQSAASIRQQRELFASYRTAPTEKK